MGDKNMSLDDIKNKLYSKEEEKDLSKRGENQYDPKLESALPKVGENAQSDLWAQKQKGLGLEEKTAIKKGAIIFGGILFVIVSMVAVSFVRRAAFSDSRVTVEVTGPTNAKSGKLLVYEINYKNDNKVDLDNVVLRLVYPENFKPESNPNFKEESATSGTISLGELKKNGEGSFVFNGRVYSNLGALIYLKAELAYSPAVFSSSYVAKNQLGINVTSSSMAIEVAAPQSVASGDEINYLISYKNVGEDDMQNIKIKADYPEGFVFSNSSPAVFEGNNIWYIGRVSAGQEGKITISGKLEGSRDEIKGIKVYVGATEQGSFASYNDENADTKIVASPFSITQIVNGSKSMNANAGQNLMFEINFKNEGSIGLRDVIVKEIIDSPVLDYSSLNIEGGIFDEANKTITWKASNYSILKSLEPGVGGTIRFSISVKGVIPIGSANDKNFVISSVSKIDSPDVPTPINANKIIAGNKMDVRLNSKLVLDTKGFYTDSNIPNTGPLPPKVGQETTYTIYWTAKNISNDVSGAKVEAVMPTNATMTGKIFPEGANITYNERTNSISWDIGNVSAGAGITSQPNTAAFQVKIKPSPNQVGRAVDLLGKSIFTAKDLFTGEIVRAETDGKNTNLTEDPSLNYRFEVVN